MTNLQYQELEKMSEPSQVDKAIKAIKDGTATRIEIDKSITVYKVPSNNPTKYTIRIDIKVVQEEPILFSQRNHII